MRTLRFRLALAMSALTCGITAPAHAQIELSGNVPAQSIVTTQDVNLTNVRLIPGVGGTRTFSVVSNGGTIRVHGTLDGSGLDGAAFGSAGENGYSIVLRTTSYDPNTGRGSLEVYGITTRGGAGRDGVQGIGELFVNCKVVSAATNGGPGGRGGNGGGIQLSSAGPLSVYWADSSGGVGGIGGSAGHGYMQGPGLSAPGGLGGNAGTISVSQSGSTTSGSVHTLNARGGNGGHGGSGSGSGIGVSSGSDGARGGNGGNVSMSAREGSFYTFSTIGGDGGQGGSGGSAAGAYCSDCGDWKCGSGTGEPCVNGHGVSNSGIPGNGGTGGNVTVAASGAFTIGSVTTRGGQGADASLGGTGGCVRQDPCDTGCQALYSHAMTRVGGSGGASGRINVTGNVITLGEALTTTGGQGGAGANGQGALLCAGETTDPTRCCVRVCTLATGQAGAEGGPGGAGGNITIPGNSTFGPSFSVAFCGGTGGRGGDGGSGQRYRDADCDDQLIPGGAAALGGLNGASGVYKVGLLSAMCASAPAEEDGPVSNRGPSGVARPPRSLNCQ